MINSERGRIIDSAALRTAKVKGVVIHKGAILHHHLPIIFNGATIAINRLVPGKGAICDGHHAIVTQRAATAIGDWSRQSRRRKARASLVVSKRDRIECQTTVIDHAAAGVNATKRGWCWG